QVEALTHRVFRKKSEKMPPVSMELSRGTPADAEDTQRKRKEARRRRTSCPMSRCFIEFLKSVVSAPSADRATWSRLGAGSRPSSSSMFHEAYPKSPSSRDARV